MRESICEEFPIHLLVELQGSAIFSINSLSYKIWNTNVILVPTIPLATCQSPPFHQKVFQEPEP